VSVDVIVYVSVEVFPLGRPLKPSGYVMSMSGEIVLEESWDDSRTLTLHSASDGGVQWQRPRPAEIKGRLRTALLTSAGEVLLQDSTDGAGYFYTSSDLRHIPSRRLCPVCTGRRTPRLLCSMYPCPMYPRCTMTAPCRLPPTDGKLVAVFPGGGVAYTEGTPGEDDWCVRLAPSSLRLPVSGSRSGWISVCLLGHNNIAVTDQDTSTLRIYSVNGEFSQTLNYNRNFAHNPHKVVFFSGTFQLKISHSLYPKMSTHIVAKSKYDLFDVFITFVRV